VADVSIFLDLDARELHVELRNAQASVQNFATQTKEAGERASTGFASSFSKLGGLITGALAGLGLTSELKSVVEYGAKIEDLHLTRIRQAEGVGRDKGCR
jgi:hypothetical protein